MTVLKMIDLDLSGKRVLIREDLNVPVKDGKVTSDWRWKKVPLYWCARIWGAQKRACSVRKTAWHRSPHI